MPKQKPSKRKQSKKSKLSKAKPSTIEKIAEDNNLLTYSIYERISKVTIGGKKTWRKNKHKIEDILDNESNFIDKELVPNQYQLDRLKAQNNTLAKNVSWFKLHSFFKEKYYLAKDFQIRKQVMKNRGYTWLVDALNVLSVQPGLIQRLFEKKKPVREGVYPVWLNFNGNWTQFIVDDYIPIFDNMNGKTQFLFSSPHPSFREIWYILIEKAMAKAYGGYYRLNNGVENYAVRDFTGAPYDMFDIVHVKNPKNLMKRDLQHMETFWKEVEDNLKKGYILSIFPRDPTQLEEIEKKKLNIPNKKYYLSKGLYSGHSYAIVTIADVVASNGQKYKILKLRNPWINEKWEGEWSEKCPLWTEKLRRKLNYTEENHNEFWISVQDLMGYFECMNIYKTTPGYTFNSIPVNFEEKRFGRVVIRVSVLKKGKYTFSVDQKDLRMFECSNLKYNAVKISLGKIEESGITLLSHTSSLKLRNTFMRKNLDKGEYYLLVERESSEENLKWVKSNPEFMKEFNEVNVSTYGPKTCTLKIAEEAAAGDTIFNYLCYYGWKSYSTRRIGKKMSEFKVNFYDQSWNKMALYLLNIPDLIIYAFKNPNEFGVELKSQIAGITNKEIVGPEGRIGFRQDFSMNPGSSDVFILRGKEDLEGNGKPVNHKFQIKSVVGKKFFGNKGNLESFKKVYDFLIAEKGKKKLTEIEKDRVLEEKVGLYETKTKEKIEMKVEIVDEVKKKQVVIPMKKEQYEDIVDYKEVERKEMEFQKEQERKQREEDERVRKEKERLQKEEEKVRREFEMRNGIVKPAKENENEGNSTEESTQNEQNDDNNSNKTLEFKEDENVLQVGNPDCSRRKLNKKKKRGKSILKNTNRNQSREKKNIIELEIQKENEDQPLDVLLKKTKEEVLDLKCSEIKTLLKYYTFKGFSQVYALDPQFTHKLIQKMSSDLEGLALIRGQNSTFKTEAQIQLESENKKQAEEKLQKELQAELELQKELQKQLEEQKILEDKLQAAQSQTFEAPSVSSQPPQQIQKLNSVDNFSIQNDDFTQSRRQQNKIDELRDMQKPLRSMSRVASPKFDKSISRRKLENRQSVEYKSPTGRDIFKQNEENKVTLSHYNLGDENRAFSIGASKIDSVCNYSNLGDNDSNAGEWSGFNHVRKPSDSQQKNLRHSYNPEIVSRARNLKEKFQGKNFRNSSQGRGYTSYNNLGDEERMSSTKPLRKSFNFEAAIREEFDIKDFKVGSLKKENFNSSEIRDSNFSQIKSEFSQIKSEFTVKTDMETGNKLEDLKLFRQSYNDPDNGRLQRLKKKLEERRKLRNINFKKNEPQNNSRTKEIPNPETQNLRQSKHLEDRTRAQDIINKAKDIVAKANKKRQKIEESLLNQFKSSENADLSLNEKIKNVREKVRKKYSRQNLFGKNARNTVNIGRVEGNKNDNMSKNFRGSYNLGVKDLDQSAFKKSSGKNFASPKKSNEYKFSDRFTQQGFLNNTTENFNKFNNKNFRRSAHIQSSNFRFDSVERSQNILKSSTNNLLGNNNFNSAASNKLITPNKFQNLANQNFTSDRRILNERTNDNIQTAPFEDKGVNRNLLCLKNSKLNQNTPSPMLKTESKVKINRTPSSPQVMKDIMEARRSAMEIINHNKRSNVFRASYVQNDNITNKVLTPFFNPVASNQQQRSNLANLTSPKRKQLELNHRKGTSGIYLKNSVSNSRNYLSPRRMKQMNKSSGNVLQRRLKSSRMNSKSRIGQENFSKEKQSYLSGVFG